MEMSLTLRKLKEKFGDKILSTSSWRGDDTVVVGKESLIAVVTFLRDDSELSYNFLVDIGAGLGYDQFLWNPVITSESNTWEASRGFSGPGNSTQPLNPWEQYAHVLLLTNEFAFVD